MCAGRKAVTTGLLVDAMGNASPIVRQVRHGQTPEGVCLVVGTLSRGFDTAANTTSDVIFTDSDIEASAGDANGGRVQYFWEAFPAGSGPTDRTTYMFAYMDAGVCLCAGDVLCTLLGAGILFAHVRAMRQCWLYPWDLQDVASVCASFPPLPFLLTGKQHLVPTSASWRRPTTSVARGAA